MCECACVSEKTTNSLGCKVGTCCPNLSSLSMCSSVVLPALSRPRNTNLPDFLYSPETKPEVFQTTSLDTIIVCFKFRLTLATLHTALSLKISHKRKRHHV